MLKFKISDKSKMTFVISMILGIITHGFIMVNKYPNWDDLGQLWDDMNRTGSGRWFLQVPASVSSMLSMPWICGLLAIFYISLAACFVADILKLKKISSCTLVSGIMLAFPALGGTMFYTNCVDAYGFGLLLMCVGVWISCRYRFGWIAGIACTVLSLATYQTYFSIGCVLYILVLIRLILEGEYKFSEVLKTAIKSLVTLLMGMLSYLIATKLYFGRNGMTSYNGIDKMGQINLAELPSDIITAYKGFINFFINDVYEFHGLLKYCFLLLVVLTVFHVIEIIRLKKIKIANVFFLVFLLVLLPLACGIIYVMGTDTVHLLMKYGFIGIFFLYIYVNDRRIDDVERGHASSKARISSYVCLFTALFIGTMIGNYIVKTNMAYFAAHVSYEQTYSYSTQLLTSIKLKVGKQESEIQKVLLVGKPAINFADSDTGWLNMKMFGDFTGLPHSLIFSSKYTYFLNKYCGFAHPIGYTTVESLEDSQIEIIREMPVYPAEGSIVCMDDGVVFVKMN